MRKIFGHRGLPQVYRENTFKSLNKAQEVCDFVETDVRITKDQELIFNSKLVSPFICSRETK